MLNVSHSPNFYRTSSLSPRRNPLRLLAIALCLGLAGSLTATPLQAQRAGATAVQDLGLSGWGTATGNWTDVSGGRNLALTAGGDLSFLTFRRFRPVLEIRGTYPFYQGKIDRQKSAMGGLKVERQFNRWHPYVDFLVGRGVISFQNGGYLYNGYLYFRTVSTVYSPGAGVDFDISHHWSAKLDFQYQHWDTPVVPLGVINPRLLSVGAIYNFDFNHHYKPRRSTLR